MAIQASNLITNTQSLFPIINTHFTSPSISSKFTLNSSQIQTKFTSFASYSNPVLNYIEKSRKPNRKQSDMTIGSPVQLSGGNLVVKDRVILSGVSEKVVTFSGSGSGHVEGGFIGAVFDEESSRHVVSLGRFNDVRFVSCFRFKLWWMSQKMGRKGSDIENETQFLLMESDGIYVVFLPLIDGAFRACLQGNSGDELEVCVESGDLEIKGSVFSQMVYVGVGTDPFGTVADAVNVVKLHLKTFKHRFDKKLPGILDYFGWCTWDAFYQDVTQEGVESGLKTLVDGGTPAKFVIIDDGWQSVATDEKNTEESESESESLKRLTGIKENEKFQNKNDPTIGIKNIVNVAKNTYGLKYVYVWHAITGYWGGVRPNMDGMEEYGPMLKYPVVSNGVLANDPKWKTDVLATQGLGLMNPKNVFKFYDNLHKYLAAAGVDGVKVDVQSILETLGSGLGGRAALTRQYHQALDASIARNFPDNGCIACMSHNTDALYCSQQTAVVRASDDFYPRDPVSHTIHVASVAYNSLFLGEFMQPDWDMFHSLHPAAEYHASARAISGGPIYVSDAPGKHNFDLLKKLVLPDGSVLRARLPGRPTVDSLFTDPTRDGVSLLKIWNMNKYTGILGIYNCQGAAWNNIERKNTFHETKQNPITGSIRARDVHLISDAALHTVPAWSGDCVVFRHQNQHLIVLPNDEPIKVSLNVLEHEIFTVSPVNVLGPGLSFAPLGLVEMLNGGGAIDEMEFVGENGSESGPFVRMMVRGCGPFGAYSTAKPRRCIVGSSEVKFGYDSESGLVKLDLVHMPEDGKYHDIKIYL